jgi:hypothetical protein
VILQGNPGGFGKKLEAAIEAEIKKAKQAPAGVPEAMKAAWTSYLKGDVAAAITECDKIASDESKAAKAQFVNATKARIARVKWLLDNGYVSEADELATALSKSVKGVADLEPKLAEQTARLASTELANEREADKAWTNFVSQTSKKKPFDAASIQRAESIAKKYPETKTAARATHLVELAKVKNA